MDLSVALALLTFHIQPLPLDRMSIERARSLDGQQVFVSILVAKPPFTWKGTTIVGAADWPDGIERGAVLVGKRLNVEGKRVTVSGMLRVVEHPAQRIGNQVGLPWLEVRVVEEK